MRTTQRVTVGYGVLVAVSGLWRHLQTGSSPQAVWFGLVMGGLAVVGALLLRAERRVPAYGRILVSLGCVGGWYLRRLLSGHPDGTSPRVLLVLLACAVEPGVLLWRPRRR